MSAIKIIITKPKIEVGTSGQAEVLHEALSSVKDVEWVDLPLFELTPKAEEIAQLHREMSAEQNDTGLPRVLVFVSPSALEISLQNVKQWPSNCYCGVMGRQSADVAMRMGVPSDLILSPARDNRYSEDSDGLLQLLSEKFVDTKPSVVICKGPRGRVEFPSGLRSLGFQVTVIETYDRAPSVFEVSKINALLSSAPSAVWITSSEAANVFNDVIQGHDSLTKNLKQNIRVLTTHGRITKRCQELGFAHVEQINTGVQSLIDWLNKYKKTTMSTQTEHSQEAPKPVTSQPAAATPALPASPSAMATPQSAQPPSKLALVISVISLVLVLFLAFMGKDELSKANQALAERIQAEKTRLTIAEESLDKATAQYAELKTRFDLLQAEQKEASNQRRALEDVYEKLIASRTAVSISEIEQLTSIAQRQLFVLGNVKGAEVALEQAVSLLKNSEEPRLISLRNAIELDLGLLRDLPDLKVIDLAIKLDLAIDSVGSLPALAGPDATTDMTLAEFSHGGPGKSRVDPVQHNPNVFQAATGFLSSFFVTAWEDIKGLIDITKVDNPEVLRLSAREIEDVRNATRLSLLNARLSLLSRQGDLLKADLARSKGFISTYFDPKSTQVSQTLSLLDEVSKAQLTIELPDLSRSLAALRLAKASEEVAQ